MRKQSYSTNEETWVLGNINEVLKVKQLISGKAGTGSKFFTFPAQFSTELCGFLCTPRITFKLPEGPSFHSYTGNSLSVTQNVFKHGNAVRPSISSWLYTREMNTCIQQKLVHN